MKAVLPGALAAVLLALQAFAAPLPAAAATAGTAHYVLDPAKSTLEFTFTQAGAQNKGRFGHFTTVLDWSSDTRRRVASRLRSRWLRWTPATRNATTPYATRTCSQ